MSGVATEKIEWRVLTTTLDPKSLKSLATMKLYYGKRLSFRSKLPAEAELPLQQFKIDYQIGNEAPVQKNPYSEIWTGPNIPASARIVKAAIVWTYPMTGERVSLWQCEIEPQQEAPEIACGNTSLRYEFDEKTNTYTLLSDAIYVDYDVPIDADNSDLTSSKSIKATLADVQGGIPFIDYASIDTKLIVYRGDEQDENVPKLKLVEGRYDATSGRFFIKIQMSRLPASGTSVRGSIDIKTEASIINRKVGVSSKSQFSSCVFAINLATNLNKSVAESDPMMETKEVSVTADVILKRQHWLSEKFKKLDFDVFYADVATVKAIHNILTPSPERTPALEVAEQECTNTDAIKKRISKRQPIPQALIDEGGSSKDCELVKQYYSALAGYEPVQQVAMLVSKAQNGKNPELLGALALRSQRVVRKDVVDLLAPIKVYSVEEAKAFVFNGTSLFDALTKQIATLDQSVIERKVMIETYELVSKSTSQKGTSTKRK
jgi:hypothetical protein